MSKKSFTIMDLRRQRLALADALMDMVNQFFVTNKDGLKCHSCMSSEENAIGVLLELGLAEQPNPNREAFILRWDKIEEDSKGIEREAMKEEA